MVGFGLLDGIQSYTWNLLQTTGRYDDHAFQLAWRLRGPECGCQIFSNSRVLVKTRSNSQKKWVNAERVIRGFDQTLVECSLRVQTGMIQNSNGCLSWVIVEVHAPLVHGPSFPW